MAHANKVMVSINNDDASRCVDIFLRPDGSYGFEEFRRDLEDARGWFAIGHFADAIFADRQQAQDAAMLAVTWLRAAMKR